jgi:hypothetical protein
VHHRPQSGELRKEELQQTMLAAGHQQPPPPPAPPSGSQALPPVPWRSGQLTRKVSGTFADKRLFEHKGWMLSVSAGRNGVAEQQAAPQRGEGGQGGEAEGGANGEVPGPKRKWMPRFSDGFVQAKEGGMDGGGAGNARQ